MDNRVKELRLEKELGQEELARKINVSQQTISRIENGTNSLPADILKNLSEYFHVSVDYILKLSDVRMIPEYRIEAEKTLERHMEICRLYDKMGKKKQVLVRGIMKEFSEETK